MEIRLPDVDLPLVPSADGAWQVQEDGLAARALPRSDLFIDPSGGGSTAASTLLNALTLLGDPGPGDLVLSAQVEVDFQDTFDAGVLLVRADEEHWAKLCFEQPPAGRPMVVSVVTRGVSDDANAFTVESEAVRLRIARVGRVIAFHASTDGGSWAFVRAFTFDGADTAHIGFEAQSPNGDGCRVRFSDVVFERRTLQDLRDGS